MGYSIDWLPDGRLLVTGNKLRRQEPDGSMVAHAGQGGNEIVVDGRGNIYLNGADFNFSGGEAPKLSAGHRKADAVREPITMTMPTWRALDDLS